MVTITQVSASLPVNEREMMCPDHAHVPLLDVMFTEASHGLISNEVKCGAVNPQTLYHQDSQQTKLLTMPEEASIFSLPSLTMMLLMLSVTLDGIAIDHV